MSTYRTNLLTRRDAIAAELAEVQNKNYQTDSHDYQQSLLNQLKQIDELLASPNSREDAADLAGDTPGSWTIYEYGEP